ncbi:MAG: hypothetical protein Roseis2KO_34310 [Roseivirga sp.]
MKNFKTLASLLLVSMIVFSCQSNKNADLKEALTFYTSFDAGTTADFAKGDAELYSAPNRRNQDSIIVGLDNEIHKITAGAGLQGDALRFTKRDRRVAYYKSKDNIAYDAKSWSGTISFWLKVDPETELEPGFTDPIQITDVAYNDASIWVDFTQDTPRKFRLGVLGDLTDWSQDTLKTSRRTEYAKRLVVVEPPHFSQEAWTHVVITHKELGTTSGISTLYLDGKDMGSISGNDDVFNWELEKSNIYLGLSFVGMLDELSIYNKAFTPELVEKLFSLKAGLKSIL